VVAPHKPRAVYCEKPMDIHWNAAVHMHEVCAQHGVRLAINHQRRFNLPLARARELLDAGEIGRLIRIDGAWHNLADTGTHVLDMMFFFNHDTPADWVLGQIDMRGARRVFGAVQTGHGICEFRFRNGVRALYRFGHQHAEMGCLLRLTGEKGLIEILFDVPWLRIRRDGRRDWEMIDTGESIHDDKAIYRGIADVLDSLETGKVPLLASDNALRATEVLFATAESARRRGRVDLPLAPGPCALLTMIEKGEIAVEFAD
jgi:predicted dehydrogenase